MIFFILFSNAQELYKIEYQNDFFYYLQNDNNVFGKVNIYQDTSIHFLINKHIRINEKQKGIPDGYRIQIFSGSGYNARNDANAAKEKLIEKFPDFPYNQIYSVYQPPFFKVRIGNYRNKHESLIIHKKLLREFPNSYLVKGRIKYPELD